VSLFRAALALAIVALAFAAAPALGGDPPIDVKGSKHKDGPYAETMQGVNVPIGEAKSLWWKVKHISGGKLDVRFTDALTVNPNPEGLKIRWFRGDKDITEAVKGAGYDFKLPKGSRKLFRAKVKAVGPSEGACVVGQADELGIPYSDTYGFAVNGPCL
jgi:hypothetical protein